MIRARTVLSSSNEIQHLIVVQHHAKCNATIQQRQQHQQNLYMLMLGY